MGATRLHVDQPLHDERTVELGRDAVAHLRARRLRVGDELSLFDGAGHVADAELLSLDRRGAAVRLGRVRSESRESPLELVLLQGLSKGDRMDQVIQKATELGVSRIVPVFTEHCVVRLDRERAARKQGHWQRVAVAACEQCGRNTVPPVAAPRDLTRAVDEDSDGLNGIILASDAESGSAGLDPAQHGIALLIGPEGGVSPAESSWLRGRGWQTMRLGPRILRTETAALAALTALQLRLGDLG